MTTFQHNPYVKKVFTKEGEGGVKIPKNLSTWFIDGP